jgi:hypothetical protein
LPKVRQDCTKPCARQPAKRQAPQPLDCFVARAPRNDGDRAIAESSKRRGSVLGQWLRLPSPQTKPDMRISRRRVEGAGAASGQPFPMKRKCRFFFLANTTGDRALHRSSPTRNPMAKLSKKPRHPEAPAPAGEPAPRVAASREAGGSAIAALSLFFLLPSQSQAARQISCRDGKTASPGNGAATA